MTWYEDDIKALETITTTLQYKPEMIFYGSSSIRLWKGLNEDFKPFYPVNLGFGGATLAACVWFFDRVMQSYSPRHIVCYAGDNDLGDGRCAEEVYLFFNQLLVSLNNRFPGVPFSFISIKPSVARRGILSQIRYTNQLISKAIEKAGTGYYYVNVFDRMLDAKGEPLKELYEPDNLHLSKQGYLLWKELLLEHFSNL